MLLALMGLAATVWAVPAKRGVTKTVTGPDGQMMTVTLRGDETFHYYVNTQGTPMRQQTDGTWAEDTRDVKALWQRASQKRNAQRVKLAEHMRRAMKAQRRVGSSTGVNGTKKGLLILVNFKDKKMQEKSTQTVFDQMLNGLNNPYGKNYGSVREFFRDQSYGQFDIEFDVVGPFTVSKNMSEYGANDEDDNDIDAGSMIKEACRMANSEVNFADYDWDSDGEVENIYVTYAGYGEADGGEDDTIWPHQWDLVSATGSSLTLDGVTINTYACGAELKDGQGTTISGIGTMCHEYSHCLGLPDFYDPDYSGGHGMFDWDLMDGGSYNGDGFCPAGYTAYERMFSGWLEPVELNTACNVNDMKAIEDNPEAYIIYNDQNRNEYYMLANHQQKGWDKEEAGKGMLILHVDYSKSVWDNNGPNDDPNHQRMTIIPADNTFNYQTYEGTKYYYANDGDTWPGKTNNTALTDTSTPKASLYNANTDGTYLMHKPIEDITEENGLISFRFMGGAAVDSPTGLAVADITHNAFRASWDNVEGAEAYNLRLTEKVESEPVEDPSEAALEALTLLEYFDKFRAESDGSQDISGSLNQYTDMPGWTGSKVYKGIQGAKLGTGSAIGYMVTPTMENESGTLTIYVEAAVYNKDASYLDVSVLDANGNDLMDEAWSIDLTKYGRGTFVLSGTPSEYKVKFTTIAKSRRLYLKKVLIFDGQITQEQIEALEEGTSATPAASPDITTLFTGITGTEYTFADLKPETNYTVQVQTVDSEGNTSKWSDAVSLTTLAEPTFAIGDVNRDGVVSIADVTMLVNLVLSSAEPTREADVDGDGQLSVADVTRLVDLILARDKK